MMRRILSSFTRVFKRDNIVAETAALAVVLIAGGAIASIPHFEEATSPSHVMDIKIEENRSPER